MNVEDNNVCLESCPAGLFTNTRKMQCEALLHYEFKQTELHDNYDVYTLKFNKVVDDTNFTQFVDFNLTGLNEGEHYTITKTTLVQGMEY